MMEKFRILHWRTLWGRHLKGASFAPLMVLGVVTLSLLPSVLVLLGLDLAAAGPTCRLLSDWSGALLALIISAFALARYRTAPTPDVPVLAALPFVAVLELGFGWESAAGASEDTGLFLWTLARALLALSLVLGGLLVTRLPAGRSARPVLVLQGGLGLLALVAAAGVLTGGEIPALASLDPVVPRPWDLVPLVLFLGAGLFVLPRLHRAVPSILNHALVLSTVPQVVSQLEAAFGSLHPMDAHDVAAHLTKLVAYATLFSGVLLDYVHTQRSREKAIHGFQSAQLEILEQTRELERVDRARADTDVQRQRAEATIARRDRILEAVGLAAEKFLADPAWQSCVGEVLENLRQATDVDRIYLTRDPDDASSLQDTWAPFGAATEEPPTRILVSWCEQLRGGASLHRRIADLPEAQQGELARRGVGSIAVVPVFAETSWLGCLILESADPERDWSNTEIKALHAAARTFGAAIQRKRIEEAVDKMKQEFISTVSHELRTPLTSIIASLGLLRSGRLADHPERVVELVEVAHRNSNRLLQLINDLLDLQKLAAGKIHYRLSPLEVRSLLEEALRGIRALADSYRVRLELESPAGLRVVGDPDRLIQVFNNLLSNAIKFSPEGEVVTLRSWQEDAHVTVAIEDHGPGIPEEFRHRLFEQFTQVDSSATRSSGGSGLGLSIVKGLVDGMQGQIRLDTRLGHGTVFYVDLPAAEGGAAAV